jgi:hypothetical protein
MGTTAFIDLNFGYAAGAAMRISGMGGGSSATAVIEVLCRQRLQWIGHQSSMAQAYR